MTTVNTSTGMAHVSASRSRPVIAFAVLAIAAAIILVAFVATWLVVNTTAPASTIGGPSLSYQHVMRENAPSAAKPGPIVDSPYEHVLRENTPSAVNRGPIVDSPYEHVLRENNRDADGAR